MLNFIIFYSVAIFFLQYLGKSKETRAFVWHNGRKGVDLSQAIGIFLINDIKSDFERG